MTKNTNNYERKCSFCGKDDVMLLDSPISNALICRNCAHQIEEIFVVAESEYKKINNKNNLEDINNCVPPSKIKEALDKFIIGQDIAKKIISVAVYNHYKRINNNLSNKENDVQLEKSNILMIGPTGCGKTLIAKTLANILNVPFAIADATTITESGYVGEDVEGMLKTLIQNADGDIKKAEKGIIYIDEIDKIARKSENSSITRDVSGEGVQQALLKIIESTISRVPMDSLRKHPQGNNIEIDTTNILFILGGAFVGLDKIITKREQGNRGLGFTGQLKDKNEERPISDLISNIQHEDLVKFGLIPELIGRIPIVVGLDELDEKALMKIIKEPKNSIIKQYTELLKIDNVDLEVQEDAIEYIAKKAKKLKTGARGLRNILEKTMLEVMYNVPDDKEIKKVIINKKSIDDPKEVIIIKK